MAEDRTSEVREALEEIDSIPLPAKQLDLPRKRVASEVAKNKEFEMYIATACDKLRDSALGHPDEDVSDEKLVAKMREARGGIVALHRALKFFRSCQSAVEEENRKMQT